MADNYYQYDRHINKPKTVRRLKWFFWGALIAVFFVIVAVIGYTFFIVKPQSENPTSSVQTKVIAPEITAFRTSYFQFQAGKNWRELETNEENVFRYRSLNGSLAEHDIVFYVNPSQAVINRLRSSRVQTVDIVDGGFERVGDISESCSKAGKEVHDNDQVTFNETTFTCVAGGVLYDVLVSEKGGDPLLKLKQPDGTPLQMAIYYRDLRAVPDGRELKQIVETFQVR